MNVDDLSTAWNELRTAALGRGLEGPKVSAKLAKAVDSEYTQWRAARETMGTVTEMLSAISTREWVTRYRNLLKKVQNEGIEVENVPPPTPLEQALQGIDKWNRNFAIGLGVGAGLAVTLWIATRRGSNAG